MPPFHPSDETLAAFVDRTLSPQQRLEVVGHLASCVRCRQIVSDAAAFLSDGTSAGAETAGSRWHVPVLSIAAAVVIAIGGLLVYRYAARRDPLHRVQSLAARMETRPVEPRLSGFAWAPVAPVRRGPGGVDPRALELRGAAGEILEESRESTDPASLHASGVSHLLVGDYDQAVAETERAAAAKTKSCGEDAGCRAIAAQYWNDVSAARWTRARALDSAVDFARAADAADRAIAFDPSLPDAHFNLGLAREALGLSKPAAAAWRDYLKVDSTSPWADEVRKRLQPLEKPTHANLWQATIPRLEAAASSGDLASVASIAGQFPQQARTWSELIFMDRWADASSAGNAPAATHNLAVARLVGDALLQHSGESLLHDSVAVVDDAMAHDPARATALAAAYQTYYRGRLQLRDRKDADAAQSLLKAAAQFAAARSPMALSAEYYSLQPSARIRASDAGAQLSSVAARLQPGYIALRAQLDWSMALVAFADENLYKQLALNSEAIELFDRLGEQENATTMRSALAGVQARLGRSADSWRTRIRVLAASTALGNNLNVYRDITGAAVAAAGEGHWDAARAMLSAAETYTGTEINPALRAQTAVWYAMITQRLGIPADEAVRRARDVALQLQDRSLRENALDDVRFAQALVDRGRDPASSIKLFDQCEAYAKANRKLSELPQLLFERALAFRTLTNAAAAESDLRRATALLLARREAIGRAEMRDSFFAAKDEVFRELVDLYAASGRYGDAFATSEEYRGLELASAGGSPADRVPLDAPGVQRTVGTNAVYTILTTRGGAVALAISRSSIAGQRIVMDPGELDHRIAGFAEALRSHSAAADARGRELYALLVRPVAAVLDRAESIAVIEDSGTSLPFEALLDDRGRYLLESHAVTYAPSATSALATPTTTGPRTGTALIVADPAVDSRLAVAPLVHAREEARAVERYFAHPTVLERGDATRARVLAALAGSDVIHLAAHAVVSPIRAEESYFLLAPSAGDPGVLTASDLMRAHLRPNQIAFLAGCRTGNASGDRSTSVSSLALAVVAAGARNVVATLWDIDDASTSALAEGFYRALRAGDGPVVALRKAQLSMLTASRAGQSAPFAWAAYEIYGSGI